MGTECVVVLNVHAMAKKPYLIIGYKNTLEYYVLLSAAICTLSKFTSIFAFGTSNNAASEFLM